MARKLDPNKRSAILTVGRALFKQKGYHETSMAEISRLVGISSGTIYLYFGSKAELVEALCEDYLTRLHAVSKPLYDKPDLNEIVSSLVHCYLEFASKEKDMVELLDLRTSLQKPYRLLRPVRDSRALITRELESFANKGCVQIYDTQIVAAIITGMMDWVSKSAFARNDLPVEGLERNITLFLQRALIKQPSE